MIAKQFKEKGILAKILEKAIEIFLKKECNKIGKIEIDIVASTIQIIKGIITKIHIKAENIDYKDLLLDKVKLEAEDVKIILKISNKELNFKNNIIIRFKISLSENSIKAVLFSNSWGWIGTMISKEMLNQDNLYDIKIRNDKLFIKGIKDKKKISEEERIELKEDKGKIYLESNVSNKLIEIPIEDKVCIKDVNISNNLINITANSLVSF